MTDTCELCYRKVWKVGERLCIRHDILATLAQPRRKYNAERVSKAPESGIYLRRIIIVAERGESVDARQPEAQ